MNGTSNVSEFVIALSPTTNCQQLARDDQCEKKIIIKKGNGKYLCEAQYHINDIEPSIERKFLKNCVMFSNLESMNTTQKKLRLFMHAFKYS